MNASDMAREPMDRTARQLKLVWAAMLASLPACAPRPEPIFDAQRSPIVWPAPPEPPRIRYIGQLSSSGDLKAPAKPFEALGNLFVGPEAPEWFYGPRSVITTDRGRKVWVADPGGRCIHVLDLEERSYAKVQQVGPAQLLTPVGLATGPDDSVYVCDSERAAIDRLSGATGKWVESVPLPVDVGRPVAALYDAQADELWVVDVSAHDIKVLQRDGTLSRIVGRRGNKPGAFNFPCDIVADGERIWVVDTGNHRVQALNRAGEPLTAFGEAGDGTGDLAMPKALAIDSGGHLYVVDARFENVQIFDREGRLLLVFGEEGNGPGEFWLPGGIHIDETNRIWVCDSYNKRVQVFEYVQPAVSNSAGP